MAINNTVENINNQPTIKPQTVTGAFLRYVAKTIPLAFDESMSYYECICALRDYINQYIDNLNNVNEGLAELQTFYLELQDYVNNYFDNLDVQEEINNKLDAMAESGELTTLISAYVDPIYQAYENEINSTVQNQTVRINLIDTKVDAVSSNTPIPVSSTSEMTDTSKVYLLTTNGYWYYYNGSEWVQGALYQATSDSADLTNLHYALGFNYYTKSASNEDVYLISNLTDVQPQVGDVLNCRIYNVLGGTISSIRLYGKTGTNTFDNLAALSKDEITSYTFTTAYPLGIRIAVVFSERDENDKYMNFILGLGNKTILNDIKTLDDNTNVFNKAFDTIYEKHIDTSSNAYNIYNIPNSGVVSGDNISLKMLNITGGNVKSIVLYGVTNPSTYTRISSINRNDVNNISISSSYDALRLVVEYTESSNNKSMDFLISKNINALLYYLGDLTNRITEFNNNCFGINYYTHSDTSSSEYNTYNIPNSGVVSGDEVSLKFISNIGGTVQSIDLYGVTWPSTYTRITGLNENDVQNIKITNSYDALRLAVRYTEPVNNKTMIFLFSKDTTKLFNYFGKLNNKIESLKNNTLNQNNTIAIFKKVCCCGDSYTSGHIVDSSSVAHATNEDFAWPSYLARLTGNTYLNAGNSGANAKTWLTATRGLPRAQSFGRVQAYTLGLMINDVAEGTTRYLELGTSSDIGTNNETYYGCYSKIIRELNNISPLAKIFIFTCPKTGRLYPSYNQAVRDIYEAYKNTYPVHLIDLTLYRDNFNSQTLQNDYTGGHYTAIGYEIFAQNLQNIISDYINNNVDDFKDVAFIPYD